MRRAFDLSRNTSLQTLETTAWSISAAGDTAPGFLKTVLSTVTSPLPLDLLINYGEFVVLCHRPLCSRLHRISPSERAAEAHVHRERFKMFSEMYAVREFRLLLCADVLDDAIEDTVRALECIVGEERMNGRLDYLPCEPLIFSEVRAHKTRRFDSQVGGRLPKIIICAL